MNRIARLTPQQRASLEAEENRALSPEEFAARVQAPWTEAERESFEDLVAWFVRRYPTPAERLRSTRVLADQWKRSNG